MEDRLNLTKVVKDFEGFAKDAFGGLIFETSVEYCFQEYPHIRLGIEIQEPGSKKRVCKYYIVSLYEIEQTWEGPNTILRHESKRIVKVIKNLLDEGILFNERGD